MHGKHGASPATTKGSATIDRFDPAFTDFGDFFEPFEPGLLFECSASVQGERNALFVYPGHIVIEGPEVPVATASVDVQTIESWTLEREPTAVHLTLVGESVWAARLPPTLAPVLEVALGKVLADKRAA